MYIGGSSILNSIRSQVSESIVSDAVDMTAISSVETKIDEAYLLFEDKSSEIDSYIICGESKCGMDDIIHYNQYCTK